MQKPLLLSFVMALFLCGCKIDRKKQVDRDKFTFRISDDSFLFFRNVRQIYYDFQDLPKARWYAYRFGDRPIDSSRPIIVPVIVVDWFHDEGYVLVEPNEFLSDQPSLIIREKAKNGRYYSYALSERGRANMLEFATKIYEGIMADNEIEIMSSRGYETLFKTHDERESFRIVMSDYYRLTRIF